MSYSHEETELGVYAESTGSRSSSSSLSTSISNLDNTNIDSDEEKQIIQHIKEEIKSKVREDIKDELAKYDLKRLESSRQSLAASSSNLPEEIPSLLPEMDIKYQEAYRKMQKLDCILRKKMSREREVKRDGKMLQKRLKEELEELQKSSRRSKEELTNTMKFLAITPSSRPEENEPCDEYTANPEPVFQTEYIFDENDTSGLDNSCGSGTKRTSSTNQTDDDKQREKMRSHTQKPNKDFIRRNKQLAGAAGDVVAMTPEEYIRLENLLRDIDSLPELPEELEDGHMSVALPAGEGFCGSEADVQKLREIETGLQSLLSIDEYEIYNSETNRESLSESHYRRMPRMALEEIEDESRLGEPALAEVKQQRNMTHRLEDVESRLSNLQKEEFLDRKLQADEMSSLVEECRRCLSQSSYRDTISEASNYDSESFRSSVSTPKLDRSTLDKLLSDARSQGIGQRWEPIEEENEDDSSEEMDERLKLPDINMYTNMSAPRDSISSRSSSRVNNLYQ